jgi:hypothetical protein
MFSHAITLEDDAATKGLTAPPPCESPLARWRCRIIQGVLELEMQFMEIAEV